LQVQDVVTVEQAVQTLSGDGVVISNVSYSYIKNSGDDSPIGTFTDPGNTIGLSGGLLLTTGSAKKATGVNNSPGQGQINSDNEQYSSELSELVPGQLIRDLCTVEFDITVSSNLLTFNYVFGSEEYIEFVDAGFNDVFGFFISGPGISGVQNLALVPNTNTPVSVNSINNIRGTSYFINNGAGDVAVEGSPIQYDGYTVPLIARANVIPCATYHIKLLIADIGDSQYDSGVFIEASSFSSSNTPTIQLVFEHDRFDYTVEGCNNVKVRVTRGALDLTRMSLSVEYYLEFLGTAILSEDYTSTLTSLLVIPSGQQYIEFDINVLADNKDEITEFVELVVTAGCVSFSKDNSVKFQIYEEYLFGLDVQVACLSEESILNPNPLYEDELFWHSSNLSCQNCSSPTVIEDSTQWYVFDAVDPVSGCTTTDSVYVIVWELSAGFELADADCFTTQDVLFLNTSENAETYYWSFGDGDISEEESPIHLYGTWFENDDPLNLTVTLIAKNEQYGCQDTIIKTVEIDEFVFIPNVITPNGDEKNEYFEINGFVGACWVLSVYDRWGSLVLQQEDYQNDWDGGTLSDGVYFYEVINDNEERHFKGSLLIIR